MLGVGHGVDHGRLRVVGHSFEVSLVVEAGHDAVEVAVKDAGDVSHRLALPELDLLAEYGDGVAAELLDGYLEGNPGAVAGALQDHAHALTLERARADAIALEPGRLVEDVADLVSGQIRNREQVPAGQG